MNVGLANLETVIKALGGVSRHKGKGKTKNQVVPYGASVLTSALGEALSGGAIVVFLGAVAPAGQ